MMPKGPPFAIVRIEVYLKNRPEESYELEDAWFEEWLRELKKSVKASAPSDVKFVVTEGDS